MSLNNNYPENFNNALNENISDFKNDAKYYYHISRNRKYVTVVTKKYWNENRCVSDGPLPRTLNNLLSSFGLLETSESVFENANGFTMEEALEKIKNCNKFSMNPSFSRFLLSCDSIYN